jgi:hypothetical protein
MKLLVATVAAMALLAIPAGAQVPGTSLPGKVEKSDLPPDEHSTLPKTDEKAYQSALDGVPQVKNHDPWHNVREAPKSKKMR